jgi:hypothetical protein
MTTTRRIFFGYLVVWASLSLAIFLHVNVFGGIDDAFRGFGHVWHPYYFNLVYAVLGIPPAVWMARHATRRFGVHSDLGRTVVLLAAAFTGWATGNTIWFYYNTCAEWGQLGCDRELQVPYPSWADLAYTSWHVCMLLAMASLARAIGIRVGDVARLWWAFVVVLAVTCWLSLPVVGLGWIINTEFTLGETVFSLGYMLGHVLVLSAAGLLATRASRVLGGVLFAPMMVLLCAAALMYVAEFAFFRTLANDTFRNAQPVEGLYAIVMLLVPIAIYGFATVRMPVGATSASSDGSGVTQLATSVVTAHARVLGPVAFELASRVEGVVVDAQLGQVDVTADVPTRAISDLLVSFEQVSGAFGAEISRLAAAPVLLEHPELDVPGSLRDSAAPTPA